MCVNIIYVCICLYCVICLILYYRSLLICTNKEFMISILPIYVKNTLALSTTTDLQQLALEADRIFLSGQPDNSTLMSTTTDDSTTEVSRIQRNNSKHHTSRTLCFFHERFRSRAKKCVKPCDWSLNYRQGQQ